MLANCLPISPGGIGVAEAASEGLFAVFAVTVGAEMMLLVRLVTVVVSIPGCFGIRLVRRELIGPAV
ncbi:hypothetical protein D3C83_132610 [compost metagenome]